MPIVSGIDGYTPFYDPTGNWKIWSLDEIYTGSIGRNKNIPKVNDYVIEPATGTLYIVTNINNVTYIPELTPIDIKKLNTTPIVSSVLDNYRIYYDRSINPFTLSPDGFMRIYSTRASYARIYRGLYIDNTKLISRVYDNTGNYLGSDVPLETVAFSSIDNYAIKSISSCNTNEVLNNGEVCTIAVYDITNKLITKTTCIVEETTYIPQAFAEQKYITNIALNSPFIPITNPDQINYPVNLPLASFNPTGIVYYNDGTQVEYTLNTPKFRLLGVEQITSTILGHHIPLVLSYKIDANESALANTNVDNGYVTRPYTLIVSNSNISYNVKLFVYPVWVDNTNGYILKYYLMNLDRNLLEDVTGKVTTTINSNIYNGKLYGVVQHMEFSIDLNTVSNAYNHFNHIQKVDIKLNAPATDNSAATLWEVNNQIPTNTAYYGTGLKALRNNSNTHSITIDNGYTTVQQFLDNTYYRSMPLYNPAIETVAPSPTHMEIRYLTESIIIPISQFNTPINFTSIVNLLGEIDIVFLRNTGSGYLKLSIVSLIVR